jgi:hypothetical protein
LTEQTHGAQALKGLAHFARVTPQFVVIDEVLVTKRNPENPLPNQRRSKMLDPFWAPPTDESFGKPRDQANGTIDRSQQERASVRNVIAAIEFRHNRALHGCKIKQLMGAAEFSF